MVAPRVRTTVSRSSSFPACGAVSGANGRLGPARSGRTLRRSTVVNLTDHAQRHERFGALVGVDRLD